MFLMFYKHFSLREQGVIVMEVLAPGCWNHIPTNKNVGVRCLSGCMMYGGF